MSARRRFDWSEARRLYAAGWSERQLARLFGVSKQSIHRAIDRNFRQLTNQRRSAHAMTGACVDCGKPISSWAKRCASCNGLNRRTTVRAQELLCTKCRSWLPDAEFINDKAVGAGRRGRGYWCKPCAKKARAASLQRKREVATQS